ncbi:SEM3F protein, partial [Polypterus senegalus]
MGSSRCGASVGEERFTDLDFADDAVICMASTEALIRALERLSEESECLGLGVSWIKTKLLGTAISCVCVCRESVDHVERFNDLHVSDGELYAGVYIDFMGTDAAIFRTMGKQTAMRTDQYNSRWLNDPQFVHAQLIPDSAERNDDKLYFFFREKSSDAGQSPVAHSRIGRICLCPGGTFTPNMKSTKDYPDEVINFMRNHPTMYNAVYPVHRRPLVVRTNVNYEFTTITVDQVDAADGRYEVLFLGTDKGTVQKVIVLPKDDMETEELILEEVEVFKQQLYVASALGVTHLALHRCDIYGEACADCCLARDPYCAWDGKSCSRYSASSKRRSRRQDVRHGNPMRQCRGYNSNANKNTLEMVQYGVEGSSTFLECQARSPQASLKWHHQKDNSDRKKEMRTDDRVLKTDQGLLIRSLQSSDAGTYLCTATENNFKHTLVRLQLLVLSSSAVNAVLAESSAPYVAALQSSPRTPTTGQYKDLLQILSQPEMGLINQYCEDYWQLGGAIPKEPLLGAIKGKELKELKEQKKPRNRRNHVEETGGQQT